MARIAATEDVEGVRDEQAVDPEEEEEDGEEHDENRMEEVEDDVHGAEEREPSEGRERSATPKAANKGKRKYVATLQEVHDAFDSVNVLRYSQPCHLQGLDSCIFLYRALLISRIFALDRQMSGCDCHPV